MKEDKKKVFIRTLGCQMNVRDSEVICGLLAKAGYAITDKPDKADIVIFNTCSVRQHAEDKVWSEIGRVSKQGKGETAPIIGIVGCMAQNYQEKIFERAPEVDFAVGPGDIEKIPGIVSGLKQKMGTVPKKRGQSPFFGSPNSLYERKIWETDGAGRPEEIYRTGFYQDKEHAYVVISEGCSNFCSYCVVPYVRGALRNRKARDILAEIIQAIDKGISRITLLGQNVNAYACEGIDFVKLIESINAVKGLKEFSFITSHPKDTSADLFEAIANLGKLRQT